jgi:drug/metabolite transporter (DMT)-like permease
VSPTSRATLIGASALLLWSTLAVLTTSSGRVPPFQMVAMAFTLASLVAVVKLRLAGRPVLATVRQPIGAWLLGVFGLFGYHCFYFMALRLAPPVEANLLNYLWPLLIVLFSALLPGSRLRLRHIVGALAGLAGAVNLIGRGGSASFDARYLAGYASAVACGVIWAVYSVAIHRYRNVPSDAVGGPCAVTAVLAVACHLGLETTVWPEGWQWLVILLIGLGPVGIAFSVWDYGCKHGDLRTLGVLAYGVPLGSNALLIAFGRGELTWPVALAALLIVGGAVIGAGDWGRK